MRGRQHDYDDHYKALVQLYIANPHFRWISKMCEYEASYGHNDSFDSLGFPETVPRFPAECGNFICVDEVEHSHPGGLYYVY